MIPYGKQNISEADIAAVVEVLKSDWITQGPVIPSFENAVAEKVGAKYGVAVNSATSALHVACLALKLGPGDWLWTSPNTFVASANCALYCGASVDFVDIDPKTYNISIEALGEKLAQAEQVGTLPKVLVPVHFAGQSCDMKAIHKLSKQYGFHVIEDASHGIGGCYQDQFIGNCTYSDITIFSFHPVKIITTGEGGMAVTNNQALAESMQMLRTHGITRDSQKLQGASAGPWYYEQLALGCNYRMTDIQAALGLNQLSRLDEFVNQRHAVASVYNRELAHLPLVLPLQSANARSAHHLYVIQVDPKSTPITRAELFGYLRKSDIGVNVHYIPVHTQPYYQNLGFAVGDFPIAESYYQQAISLPMYAALTEADQTMVINTLNKILND